MIDDNTAHELAGKLHGASGKISRAMQYCRGSEIDLADAKVDIMEVIADLLCSESVESRMAHHRMPVIPRDDNPPTDPNLTVPKAVDLGSLPV